MKNVGRALAAIFLGLVCLGVYQLYDLYRLSRCPPPEVTDERPIIATDWLVQMRGQGCGFGISYMTDVRLIKRDGSNIIVLVTGDDIDQVRLDTSQDRKLILAIPNKLRNIQLNHKEVPGVDISLRFLNSADDTIKTK